jgi:transcriptional regulator with XRE-family HTH domain
MSFGNKLKEIRKINKLTQKQMGEKLLLEQSTYSRYESGMSQPNMDIVNRIVETFGVTLNSLMQSDDRTVFFEQGSSNNGFVHSDNCTYYSVPKEVLADMAEQQKNIALLLKILEKRIS